jgi:hypothetical protein
MKTVALAILVIITKSTVLAPIREEDIFPPTPVSEPISAFKSIPVPESVPISEPIPAFKPTPPSGKTPVGTLTTTDETESAQSREFQRNLPEDEQNLWKTLAFLVLSLNSIFICLMEYRLRRSWHREDKIKEEISQLKTLSEKIMKRLHFIPTEQKLSDPASMVPTVKMATPRKIYTVASKTIGEKDNKVPISNSWMGSERPAHPSAVKPKVDSWINERYMPRKSTAKIPSRKIDLSKIQGKFIAWRKTQMHGGGDNESALRSRNTVMSQRENLKHWGFPRGDDTM